MKSRRAIRRRNRTILISVSSILGCALICFFAVLISRNGMPSFSLFAEEPPVTTPEAPTPFVQQTPILPTQTIEVLPTPSPTPPPYPITTSNADFSLFWFTDTQHYASAHPNTFFAMTNWMKDNIDTYHVKYAIFTGDFVNHFDKEDEWAVADEAMKALDGNLDYIAIAGNHDVGNSRLDYTNYLNYFGKKRFSDNKNVEHWYENGKGRCALVSAGGVDFIIIGYGYGVDASEGNAWINSKLKEHEDRKAILIFHDYMDTDGLLLPKGKVIYENVVKANPNVFLVLCGHRYNCSLLVTEISDDGDSFSDRTVYNIMMNYQGFGQNGGDGYLSLIQFYSSDRMFTIDTYSPLLDKWYYFDPTRSVNKERLVLPVTIFDPPTPRPQNTPTPTPKTTSTAKPTPPPEATPEVTDIPDEAPDAAQDTTSENSSEEGP